MVKPGGTAPSSPQWRQKRDPVPNLDQRITAAVAAEQFGRNRPRENQVSTGVTDDFVAIAPRPRRRTRGVRRAHHDVDTGSCPAGGDRAGMQF